jgi:hypothetical protein
MTTSRDDDAPPIQAGSAPAERVEAPTVLEQAELAEDAEVEAELAAAQKASAQLSSAALITLGIVGGIYLLYTIGWAIVVARTTVTFFPLDSVFLEVCFRIGQFLSIAAAPLWFVSTLLLTQRRTWRSRLGWLLLGVFVLVPWPFIQGA